MRTISILTALTVFCFGSQSADAGFLGMPLNLKAVIEHVEFDAPAASDKPSGEFLNDDALIGSALV
jgi:hypothetical protein